MDNIKNNIKQLEECLSLPKGSLENSFVQMDSLSAATVLSTMMEEMIKGIATALQTTTYGRRRNLYLI